MDLESSVKSLYQEIRARMIRDGMLEEYTREMRIVMRRDPDRPDLTSIYIYPVTDPNDKIDPLTLKRIK